MIGQVYNEILQMIMKRMKDYNISGIGGYQSYNPNILPYSPPDKNDDDQGYDPYDPKSYRQFEDYDYHLIYNEDEDLIGFTSMDGKINYTLDHDSFEDLVTISVSTDKFSFKIALIFEFYDIRKNDPETDDKGKLTDVIILGEDGKPIPDGYSITPLSVVIDINKQAEFKAYIKNIDGTTSDVTNLSTWTVNDNDIPISNGVVTGTKTGSFVVMAKYQYNIATAQIEINDFVLEIQPLVSSFTIEEGETYTVLYRALLKDGMGRLTDVTDRCVWSTSNWTGSLSDGFYSVVANSSGESKITAKLDGKTAIATLSGTQLMSEEPIEHDYDYMVQLKWVGDDDVDLSAKIDNNEDSLVAYYTGKDPRTPSQWTQSKATYVGLTTGDVLALDVDDVAGFVDTHIETITVLGFNTSKLQVYFNMFRIDDAKDDPITVDIYKLQSNGLKSLLKTYTFTGSQIPSRRNELKQVCELDLNTGTLIP